MYILTGNKRQVVDSRFVERFCIDVKDDAALVIASYGSERNPVTLARYRDEKEAKEVLIDLFGLLSNNSVRCYEMPESLLYAEQRHIKDARTRRKGGS